MLAIHILGWLLLGVEAVVALPVLYLCTVSLSALLLSRKPRNEHISPAPTPRHVNFAILIPAHDEIAVLGYLLESLAELDYPEDHYAVYLVADNCTDTTAEFARANGRVHVYERFDEEKRGKGYALNWLWQRLKEDQLEHDAYVILDADSVVEPTFLRSMNRELLKGARALQANNTVLNVSDSPSTALRWVALTLMNYVRPLGRNGLGASSTLTGNGMCLSRELLLLYPWQAYSLSEDYQYYLQLVKHGERVQYVPEAVVRSQMPTTFAQMRTQDVRWESSGANQKPWKVAQELLYAGMKSRDFVRIEAIAELLTPSLSSMVCACLFVIAASLGLGSLLDLCLGLLLLCGLTCYIATALVLLRPPRVVYVAFLHAPGFMLWKLWVLLVLKKSKKHTGAWVRTSRAG
jgi:cellulose synthase/poly-beta-1,6-N-acetylglucosamine synthase-like glycosyltransferase